MSLCSGFVLQCELVLISSADTLPLYFVWFFLFSFWLSSVFFFSAQEMQVLLLQNVFTKIRPDSNTSILSHSYCLLQSLTWLTHSYLLVAPQMKMEKLQNALLKMWCNWLIHAFPFCSAGRLQESCHCEMSFCAILLWINSFRLMRGKGRRWMFCRCCDSSGLLNNHCMQLTHYTLASASVKLQDGRFSLVEWILMTACVTNSVVLRY